MKNPLIDFFSAYGPVANGQNMYDEFVVEAAKKAGVAPLVIKEPRSEKIAEILMSDEPRTVVLTGTAGDGKTYTARKVLDRISGGTAAWTNEESEISVVCPSNGKTITFVKDLSEVRADDKKKLVPRVIGSIFGDPESEIFVLCVNDGHLLKTWRENAGDDPRAEMAISIIQGMLRDDLEEVLGIERMTLLNMSRTSHAATLDAIVDAIMDHQDWERCSGCSALEAENPCPIRVNREILMLTGPATIRSRLRSLIEIAAADDAHLSIRQIMIVVVNALLGDRKAGSSPLLDCNRARLRAGNGEYMETNPYSNIFGENHPQRRRLSIQAFETLARFEIGNETNNYFDDALLDPPDGYKEPLEDRYGAAIFTQVASRYREDPRAEIDALRPAIRDQRRRLFFLSPDISLAVYRDASPWHLTAYHWGDIYVDLLRPATDRDEVKLKAAQRQILKGLNRTLTGALTETDDSLWLTQPSGVYLGREKPLLAIDPLRWKGRFYWLELSEPNMPGRPPRLEIRTREKAEPLSSFSMTPVLFEYLVRVAHGALPTSFSNQCYQDIRNFQIRSVGAITKAEREEGGNLPLVAVDTIASNLTSKPIGLLEDSQ